ncbi:MAG: hypothetical protein EBW87_03905 [Burkholderiaceae bacterium]|nr:hypothetical protein [Burkholderiaceae bacterium]
MDIQPIRAYFNVDLPNTQEWVMMKRIAIERLMLADYSMKEISTIIGLSYKNVTRQSKFKIDWMLDRSFDRLIRSKIYPKKKGTKVVWE